MREQADQVEQWVSEICRRAIAPAPMLTVAQWADRYRILPPTSAEPGPWRTERLPFLREIMDAMTPGSPIERVVVMKSAQVGCTEALLNLIGFAIHHVPSNILLVMPSTEMIRRNTPTRIDPFIDSTPVLRERVVPFRSRDPGNTVARKAFRGGELLMVGANSPAAFRSIPARFILLDEVDSYPGDVGGEGDPVALASRAAMTFRGRRKIVLVSTPTIAGFSRIERAFLEGDQRRLLSPCFHCAEPFEMRFEHITWPKGRRELAQLTCPHCGCGIEDHQRLAMLGRSFWKATAEGDGRTASFAIGGLASPFTDARELAIEHGQAHRDPARLKTFKNIRLGELWSEDAEPVPAAAAFLTRLEEWGERLPAGVVALTAGVDVQNDRLELEIVGWGRDEENWSIEHQVLWGDPAGKEVWQVLDQELARTFPHRRKVPALPILAACVDSGGHHTQSVVRFCAERHRRRIWAIKGIGGPGRPLWPKRPSKSAKSMLPIYALGVDAGKEQLMRRLAIATAGPGYCHFPEGRDLDYFQQLTAERLVTRYDKGRPVRSWQKAAGDRNEALDCRVYAMAALQGAIALGLRLNSAAAKIEQVPLFNEHSPIEIRYAVTSLSIESNVITSPWMQY